MTYFFQLKINFLCRSFSNPERDYFLVQRYYGTIKLNYKFNKVIIMVVNMVDQIVVRFLMSTYIYLLSVRNRHCENILKSLKQGIHTRNTVTVSSSGNILKHTTG